MSDSLPPHRLQHTRPPCSSPTPRVYSDSCLLSWCCNPTTSSSVVPFSSCLQSFRLLVSCTFFALFISLGFNFLPNPNCSFCFRSSHLVEMSMILSASVIRVRDGLPLSASTDYEQGTGMQECRKYFKVLSRKLAQLPDRCTLKTGRYNIK